jgi:hypothetical protein
MENLLQKADKMAPVTTNRIFVIIKFSSHVSILQQSRLRNPVFL